MDRVALHVEADLALAHHAVVLRAGFVTVAVRATKEAKSRVGILYHPVHHLLRASGPCASGPGAGARLAASVASSTSIWHLVPYRRKDSERPPPTAPCAAVAEEG